MDRSEVRATGRLRFGIELSARRLVTAITSLALLNLFFVATTYACIWAERANVFRSDNSLGHVVVRNLCLAYENVVAAWYSSMIILLASVLALICFVADSRAAQTRRDVLLSRGWIVVAAIFATLSLDEVGSLHERIGNTPWLNPFGGIAVGWVVLLAAPIAMVGIFLFAFAALHLTRRKAVALLFASAVVVYLSVPIQERIENLWQAEAAEQPDIARPISEYCWEEGSEIFGTLLFVTAIALQAFGAAHEEPRDSDGDTAMVLVDLDTKRTLRVLATALIVGYGAVVAAEVLVRHLPPGDPGIPNNWFPSALAALSALTAIQIRDTRASAGEGRSAALPWLSVAAIVLSAYYGAHMRGWLNGMTHDGSHLRPYVNTAVLLAMGASALATVRQARSGIARACIASWPLLLLLAFSGWQRRGDAGWVDYSACALLFFGLVAELAAASSRAAIRSARIGPMGVRSSALGRPAAASGTVH